MNLKNLLKVAITAIMSNKWRTFLSTLGIIIGVAAVITMMAIGQGSKDSIRADLQKWGTNLLTVRPGGEMRGGVRLDPSAMQTLKQADYEAIRDGASLITHISPEVTSSGQVIYGAKNTNSTIYGESPDYMIIKLWDIENGQCFTDEDVRKNAVAFSWQLQGGNQSGSFQIANVRCVNMPTYTVKFYHGKELLDSNVFVKGEYPFYRGKNIASSEKYNYEIVGWKPELKEVTADVNYQVVLDSFVRTYDVTFNDDEGYTLYRQYLEYGEVPSYAGMDPVKLPSVGYSYKFKGWGKQICEEVEKTYCYDKDEYCDTWTEYVCHVNYVKEFPPVTSSVEYFPVYDSTANSYTVKFADYDGKTLSEKRYAYGTKAKDITKPKDPSRAKAGDVEYSFEKWTPSVSDVNGDAVYVATYNAKKVENGETVPVEIYTVVFANGDSVLQVGEYAYGDWPEYEGPTPTKDSTAKKENKGRPILGLAKGKWKYPDDINLHDDEIADAFGV